MNDIIKKQMKDVIVPQNDIVRRPVIVPEPRSASIRRENDDRIDGSPFFEKRKNKTVNPHETKKNDSRMILWALLFVVVLAIGFALANYFATSTVEISPIVRSATLNADITALKDSGTDDGLVFQFMSLVEEKTKEIPATVEKKIRIKASGKVVIYNAYSKDDQRLIKNTRLEAPNNKIFRIDQSVVVPGMKVINGKNVLGSVEAVIYADAPGPNYNIDKPVDFTIPGFKGEPRYTKFYARSKPEVAITGGFDDTIKVPSDEEFSKAKEELKEELKKEATAKARAEIPGNVSFFPGSTIIKFEEVQQDLTEKENTKVSVRATISVFFFDTTAFIKKLAEVAIPDEKEKSFTLPSLSALTFTFIDPVDNVVLSDISKLRFRLAGDATFVGQVDKAKIQSSLAGTKKNEFGSIIASQNNISKADVVIRPMWKTVFPTDTSKIVIKILEQ